MEEISVDVGCREGACIQREYSAVGDVRATGIGDRSWRVTECNGATVLDERTTVDREARFRGEGTAGNGECAFVGYVDAAVDGIGSIAHEPPVGRTVFDELLPNVARGDIRELSERYVSGVGWHVGYSIDIHGAAVQSDVPFANQGATVHFQPGARVDGHRRILADAKELLDIHSGIVDGQNALVHDVELAEVCGATIECERCVFIGLSHPP